MAGKKCFPELRIRTTTHILVLSFDNSETALPHFKFRCIHNTVKISDYYT